MDGDWLSALKAIMSNSYVSTSISTFVSAFVAYSFAEKRSLRERQRAQQEKDEKRDLEASDMALQLALTLEAFAVDCGKAIEAVQPQGLRGAIGRHPMPLLTLPAIDAKVLDVETYLEARTLAQTVGLAHDRLEEQWQAEDEDLDWSDVAESASWHFKEQGLKALILSRDIRSKYNRPKLNPSDFQKMFLDMLRMR